jgi:hypothetical protein
MRRTGAEMRIAGIGESRFEWMWLLGGNVEQPAERVRRPRRGGARDERFERGLAKALRPAAVKKDGLKAVR